MTQIKQHTLQSGERILLVQVQEEAFNFDYHQIMKILVFDDKETGSYMDFIQLPMDGNWQLIGLSDEITEEQAATVIDVPSLFMYVDYTAKVDFGMKRKFDTALESFKSLMQSLACEGRYAVLREVV